MANNQDNPLRFIVDLLEMVVVWPRLEAPQGLFLLSTMIVVPMLCLLLSVAAIGYVFLALPVISAWRGVGWLIANSGSSNRSTTPEAGDCRTW